MSNATVRLTEKEISGYAAVIDVSPAGVFTVALRDSEERLGRGESMAAAVAAARAQLAKRRVKVEVPFRTRGGERGVATGRRAGSTKITVRVDGRADQYEGRSQAFKPDTPDPVLESLNAISRDRASLNSEERALESEWALRLGYEVDRAMEAAAAEEAQAEETG